MPINSLWCISKSASSFKMASGGKDLDETTAQLQVVKHPHKATGVKDLDEATAQPMATQHPQKAKGNFPTGYECEFIEPPPKILTTECSVCLHIPREPHQVSCCGQHFCKSCIERTWSENKPCPLCNQLDFTATLDKNVQRHLGDRKVYCTNKEQGCEWVGELRHLDHHLNANPKSGEELTGCEFVEANCIHGCGGRIQRRSRTEHHNKCPSRPFSCDYCNHVSTYQEVVINHGPVCLQYPLPCPNSCEDSPIERQHFEDHQTTCPSRPFSCEYCGHSSTYQDVVTNHWPECPQYPLPCPNSCEDSPIERQHFEDHQTTCPSRPFSCEYCGHSSTYQDMVANHWSECPQYPLPCHNSCEDSPIERQNLEDHLNKECPLGKVKCEFQYAGCTAQVQRRDLAAHMKHNLPQHISQLSSTTRILAADIQDEIKQKLEQQTTILKHEMEQCQQNAEGMVKQEQAEAKARQEDLEGQLQELKQMTKTAFDNTQTSLQETEGVVKQEQAEVKTRQEDLERKLRELKAASDNTQTSLQHTKTSLSQYGMIVAVIILALVAVLAVVLAAVQHRQIQHLQQLRQDHIEATERLSDGLQNLQYQLHHGPEHVSPSRCTADGPGLHSPTVDVTTEFTVSVVNILGIAYSGKGVSVTAELESDGTFTQAKVSCMDTSKYRITYRPIVRGWSKLYVKVNNSDIIGSPFSIPVSPEHPQKIGGLKRPWGIAINSHGEIFVTEWWRDKVSVFGTNRENRTIGSRGTGDGKFMYPAGIDIDADDNVYVASELKLQKFNRNGEHVKSADSNKEIRGVKVHNNKVYVCDRDNQILVYDLELTLIRQFGTRGTGEGKFINPYDIDFDAKGNAYVVDSGNNRVQVLKEDGQYQRGFGMGKLNTPCGIHISGEYVYVSQSTKVVVFRTSGEYVTTIATTIGEKLGRVCGITTDSNETLYVCDYILDRCIIL